MFRPLIDRQDFTHHSDKNVIELQSLITEPFAHFHGAAACIFPRRNPTPFFPLFAPPCLKLISWNPTIHYLICPAYCRNLCDSSCLVSGILLLHITYRLHPSILTSHRDHKSNRYVTPFLKSHTKAQLGIKRSVRVSIAVQPSRSLRSNNPPTTAHCHNGLPRRAHSPAMPSYPILQPELHHQPSRKNLPSLNNRHPNARPAVHPRRGDPPHRTLLPRRHPLRPIVPAIRDSVIGARKGICLVEAGREAGERATGMGKGRRQGES